MDIAPSKNEALKEVQDILASVLRKCNISITRKENRFYKLMMARNTKHIWWQKGYKRWLPYCIYVSMES